jgi:hypothetical protein
MHGIGSILLEKILNSDSGDCHESTLLCEKGHKAKFLGNRSKKVVTILAPVVLQRAYYHCADCEAGFFPKDKKLDMVNTTFSPGVRKMMARVGAKESFEEGKEDLKELAGIDVTIKEVGRVAEAIGAQIIVDANQEREQAMKNSEAVFESKVIPLLPRTSEARSCRIPILYIAIDGTGVPVVPSETIGRKGKQTEIAKTREAKLGAVFTQTSTDEEGLPIRDEGSTSYVGAIETAEEFGPRIYAEAVRRGLNRAQKVVQLGDGALWIRGIGDEQFPNAIQIVDLFHAFEYLWDVGKLVYGTGEIVTRWFKIQKDELKEGDVEKVIAAIKRLKTPNQSVPVQEEIEGTVHYFETNRDRMKYAEWIKEGLFVGSGVIEAGCKTIVGRRLKQSGMRWTVKGANEIIALRCCQISGQWEDYWENRAAA